MFGRKIILASASPRRKELFKMITEEYSVISPDIFEIVPKGLEVFQVAEYLAAQKAVAVANGLSDGDIESVIIGCDTVVIYNDEMLGKPRDKEDARRMLELLSGKKHCVTTGCCVYSKQGSLSFCETTEVEFYKLGSREIDEYVMTDEPFDKAGAYGIQGSGGLFVRGITGDYYNVVGLPVARLKRVVEEFINNK